MSSIDFLVRVTVAARSQSSDRDFGALGRDFGPLDRNFGPLDRDFGPSDRDFGPSDRDFGPLDRDFGPPDRDFDPLDRDFDPLDRDFSGSTRCQSNLLVHQRPQIHVSDRGSTVSPIGWCKTVKYLTNSYCRSASAS